MTTGLSCTALALIACTKNATNQSSPANFQRVDPALQATTTGSAHPQITKSADITVLSSGSFVDGEHPTRGTARVKKQNNERWLELDSTFTTSASGPDLVVVLHRSADVIGSTAPPAFPLQEGDYIFLAPLRSYAGEQSYPISGDINLSDFKSAVIWCRRFNATFGAATLKP
ncbi:MAG: DM13 domain-containing protein [Prochlorococcaceae cyanobacterium]